MITVFYYHTLPLLSLLCVPGIHQLKEFSFPSFSYLIGNDDFLRTFNKLMLTLESGCIPGRGGGVLIPKNSA